MSETSEIPYEEIAGKKAQIEASRKPDEIFSLAEPFAFQDNDFPYVSWNRAIIEDMARGTVNLINLCVDRNIDTIFFLDRSARNAAYLFSHTWEKLMPGVNLPQMRFINIGKGQKEMAEAFNEEIATELREKYTHLTPAHILVADDSSVKGESLNRGVQVVQSMYSEAKQVIGTNVFRLQPDYSDKELKGVAEVPYDSSNPTASYIVQPLSKTLAPGQIPYFQERFHKIRDNLDKLSTFVAEQSTRSPIGSFSVKPLIYQKAA